MLPEKFRAYFSFTRRERVGISVLVLLIIFAFALPYFYPSPGITRNRQQFEEFKNEIAQLKTQQHADSFSYNDKRENKQEENNDNVETSAIHPINEKTTLFYFDPNTATPEQWKRLGLRDNTIKTINKYLSKGGRFRAANDLQKIYGLKKEEFDRIEPYVKIDDIPQENDKPQTSFIISRHRDGASIMDIDINLADTSAFIALPGIGSKLANRIINFREKLGGFYSVDQIAETYGLPDSVFQKLKSHFKINETQVRKININTADVNLLKQHPYVKWNIANAIIQYRQQHGTFKSVDEIQQIDAITPEMFKKMEIYLTIN